MRLVFRGNAKPDSSLAASPARCYALPSFACAALLGATLSLLALPIGAHAQEPASSTSTDAGSPALASLTPAAAAAPETAAADGATEAIDAPAIASSAQLLNARADVLSMADGALDDQVLARQRGSARLTMVAATPQLRRGGSVTLWDEIAPPTPLPIPIDAARTAQGNAASYLRK